MRILSIAIAAVVGALPSGVAAHGRPPALEQIEIDPTNPDRIVAQATFGTAISEDGGASWHWACAAALDIDARMEDPVYALTADGHTLVASFDGLRRDDRGFCEFEFVSHELEDVFVIDVQVEPNRPDHIWAIATDGMAPDRLHRSTDSGGTFVVVGDDFGDVLLERIRFAPSRAERIYASGQRPRRVDVEPAVFVFRSDDGGDRFDRFQVPVEEGEYNLFVHAVDPADPDRVFGQIVHFNGEATPERLVRSDDGGQTWVTPVRIPQISAIAITASGAILAGSRLGGLWASTDDGTSFEPVQPELHVRCLEVVGDEVLVCTDQGADGFALARTPDDAQTVEPILTLPQIDSPHPCPRCTAVGTVCPAWLPDVIVDLGLEVDLPDGAVFPDGGTGRPRDAGVPAECIDDGGAPTDAAGPPGLLGGGGCSCRGGSTPAMPSAPAVLLAALLVLAWPRRGPTPR